MPATLPVLGPLAALVLLLLLTSIVGAWIGVILRFAFGLRVLPPNTPRLVPWGPWSVLFTIIAYLGIQILVVYGYAYASGPRPMLADGTRVDLAPAEKMVLSAYLNAAVLILVPLTLMLTSGARPKDLGIVSEGLGRQVFRGVVAYPLLAPIVFGVMAISVALLGRTNHPLQDAITNDRSPGVVAVLVLAGVILAPAAEELLFRGVLLGWLTRLAIGRSILDGRKPESSSLDEEGEGPSLGDPTLDLISPEIHDVEISPSPTDREDRNPYAEPLARTVARFETVATDPSRRIPQLMMANVIVSLIFAALHGAVWPTPIPIFFLSMGLGLLYQRTGSLIPSTVLHMTFNGISTLLMFLTLGAPPPKEAPIVPSSPPAPAKVASTLATGLGPPLGFGIAPGAREMPESSGPTRGG